MRILLCLCLIGLTATPALAGPPRVDRRDDSRRPQVQRPFDRETDRRDNDGRPCDEEGLRHASQAPTTVSRLAELPTADMHLLVRRRVNGCSVQTIVVRDVEANITRRAR